MSYQALLDEMRENASTPVEAPEIKGGMITKPNKPVSKVSNDYNPTDLMTKWMGVIRNAGEVARQKSKVIKDIPKPEETEAVKKLSLGDDPLEQEALDYYNKRDKAKAEDYNIKDVGGGTTNLIRRFEGFRDSPYWDVNAYRVGYGSDTITKADGSVVKVEPGMKVSKKDAERDLKRRVGEFQDGIVSSVGEEAWTSLPPRAKSALTSVAYNYGSLPDKVVSAVKGGNTNAIATAVEQLAGHNDGINASRRMKEAQMIRGS